MNRFKTFFFSMYAAAAWITPLSITVAGEPHYTIRLNSGDSLKCDKLTADSEGNLTFVRHGEPCLMAKRFYECVVADKPEAVVAAEKLLAEKKYPEAAQQFDFLAERYGFCGWDGWCRLQQAEALRADGRRKEAIAVLAVLTAKPAAGPEYRNAAVESARLLLARLYAEAGEREKAVAELSKVVVSADDGMAVAGYNLLGEMLVQDGRTSEAVLCFMRPVINFDRATPNREYALRRLSKLLADMDDSRSKVFEAMLKREYPSTDK